MFRKWCAFRWLLWLQRRDVADGRSVALRKVAMNLDPRSSQTQASSARGPPRYCKSSLLSRELRLSVDPETGALKDGRRQVACFSHAMHSDRRIDHGCCNAVRCNCARQRQDLDVGQFHCASLDSSKGQK
ncbi:hypothetical protein IWZ03DRAFT_368286 [Phyllosticta citriasiana]|uniref:Uncharacterized protein n=1 Tax=Phyllosticta citriasiana TaxID=595635 RepID=A0ABR1L194_9PEZI